MESRSSKRMTYDNENSPSTVAADVVIKAAEAARDVSNTAGTVAAEVVVEAARAAKTVAQHSDERTTQALADALREVFGENQRSNRFIDVSRIPLICMNINGIHESLGKLVRWTEDADARYVNQDQYEPVKKAMYGLITLILIAVVGAIMALIIK